MAQLGLLRMWEVGDIMFNNYQLGCMRKLVNLLGTYGNFGVDSDANGLADGWGQNSTASRNVSNNVQTYTVTIQYGGLTFTNVPFTVGDKFYGCMFVKTNSNMVGVVVGDNDSTPAVTIYTSGSNQFEFLSGLLIPTASSTLSAFGIHCLDWRSSGTTPISVKNACLFNLTKVFGAGKEPSKADMDAFMQKALVQGYFVERDYVKS